MKCKDCTETNCRYRSSNAEQGCHYIQNGSVLEVVKEDYIAIRTQAAIAAMQGTISMLSGDCVAFKIVVADNYTGAKKSYPNEIAEFAVACADALIEELKKGE